MSGGCWAAGRLGCWAGIEEASPEGASQILRSTDRPSEKGPAAGGASTLVPHRPPPSRRNPLTTACDKHDSGRPRERCAVFPDGSAQHTAEGADGSYAGAGRCFGRRRGPLCHCACWRCVRVRLCHGRLRAPQAMMAGDARRGGRQTLPGLWTPDAFPGAKGGEGRRRGGGGERTSKLGCHALRPFAMASDATSSRAATTRVTLLLRVFMEYEAGLENPASLAGTTDSLTVSPRVSLSQSE